MQKKSRLQKNGGKWLVKSIAGETRPHQSLQSKILPGSNNAGYLLPLAKDDLISHFLTPFF